MDINDLTIGQAKELRRMFGGEAKSSNILASAIGKYVIVRSRNEGINAGILKEADETGCVLGDARRVWYHKPKNSNTAWYEGVADNGVDSSSKLSCVVEEKYIVEDYSVTICTKDAEKSIRDIKSHES